MQVEYRQKSRLSTIIWPHCMSSTVRCQVLYTQLRRTVANWWHSSLVSDVVCCSRETTTKCLWQEASTLRQRQQNSIWYSAVNLKPQ